MFQTWNRYLHSREDKKLQIFMDLQFQWALLNLEVTYLMKKKMVKCEFLCEFLYLIWLSKEYNWYLTAAETIKQTQPKREKTTYRNFQLCLLIGDSVWV